MRHGHKTRMPLWSGNFNFKEKNLNLTANENSQKGQILNLKKSSP